ncbi:MAG: Arginyl-tRNA--protein transferase 1 [Alectoria fallacina]|uniref:Arginyl-tRNA--protein transferase 1 n=1 Tax=Alectoria fallacina TaxID=1903189 RepID=A0A8H3I847_9LECA|nr:MAG: Arginyl-tRNA--protein transferase 1 [Alectoria fallacina]
MKEKKRRKNKFDVYEAVHESEYRCVRRPIDTRTKTLVEPAHKFEVTLEPDNFTEEKYALFANYQKNVHHEGPSDISKSGFKRFLCSGLPRSTRLYHGKEKRIGSYHQCYRLDGKLIALGVLDLLHHCVSSVYLIYHEDVSDWNFGKLSALREISLALEGDYQYYYMGYYIHSCIKMRYKATFRPTYILDPQSHIWDPLDSDMMQRLSAREWVSLAIERALKISSNSLTSFLQSDRATTSNFGEELNMGPSKFKLAVEYAIGQDRKQDSEGKEATDCFHAGTPGALSLEEVEEKIDLGQWKLKLGQRLVKLENLVGWDESEMSDSSSIKGIAAELAACIGPDLVQKTALHFG